jgi:hypothetical protein
MYAPSDADMHPVKLAEDELANQQNKQESAVILAVTQAYIQSN